MPNMLTDNENCTIQIDQLNDRVTIEPVKSSKKVTVSVPPSKSHSIRGVLLSAMATGESSIKNILKSPDIDAAITAAKAFGANIEINGSNLLINGVAGKPQTPRDVVNAGNSGQVLRFGGALAAHSRGYTVITGDASLRKQRYVDPLISGLRQLGAFAVDSRGNGRAPIVIRGPIRPGEITVSGEDSQPVSGLMMTSALLDGITTINVEDLGERPWLDFTIDWLARFGVEIEEPKPGKFVVHGNGEYKAIDMVVPGDFSSAAMPAAAALITGSEIILKNLNPSDLQGDKQLFCLWQKMGAKVEFNESSKSLSIGSKGALSGGEIDCDPIIDAIPILAAVGCYGKEPLKLYNGRGARYKECDRISCVCEEFQKLGAKIEEHQDGMVIHPSKLHGGVVDSHGDHRLAMALSIAALGASGSVTIQKIDCISKSYPGFFEMLKPL